MRTVPTNKNKDMIDSALLSAVSLTPRWKIDSMGNPFGWLRLATPQQLLDVVQALSALGARLCTITAYTEHHSETNPCQAMAYHFSLTRAVFTVTYPAYDEETKEARGVPSITPWFRNADWNEREFKEMFNIKVTGHPNPKRLFLDERFDAGIMKNLIPFSAMVHGAATRNLWEQVMATKGIDITKADPCDEPHLMPQTEEQKKAAALIVDPVFTAVSATEHDNTAFAHSGDAVGTEPKGAAASQTAEADKTPGTPVTPSVPDIPGAPVSQGTKEDTPAPSAPTKKVPAEPLTPAAPEKSAAPAKAASTDSATAVLATGKEPKGATAPPPAPKTNAKNGTKKPKGRGK